MNTRVSLAIGSSIALLLLGGCVIDGSLLNGTGGSAGTGGTGNTGNTSSSSSSSSGDVGGTGGTGGTAGAGVGGAGGGGGSCVSDKDGILDALTCEKLNTQQTGNVCGPNKDLAPLANGTCTHGFDIYQRGAFDVLANCLQTIGSDVASACDDNLVTACVKKMYQAACPSADASTLCEGIAQQGCPAGENFNTQGCVVDTTPLNTTALNKLVDCINMSPDPSCNSAYSTCFGTLLSF